MAILTDYPFGKTTQEGTGSVRRYSKVASVEGDFLRGVMRLSMRAQDIIAPRRTLTGPRAFNGAYGCNLVGGLIPSLLGIPSSGMSDGFLSVVV